MRKKVILIVALAVLIVLGTVFALLNIHAPGELSAWKRSEIEFFYWAKMQNKIGTWYDEGNQNGPRYYGTYDGYAIILKEGYHDTVCTIPIANRTFRMSVEFQLYAYKNGEFFLLKDVYEQGLISEEAIESVWFAHCENEEKQK